ncbi:hypothetical protein [Paenibacillus koleovorans]|uniref:hypothetical protein n=1 Tax=Paenibacillus koleovorans TaxID=121608 RepID=UPI000FD81367|nr:hypothetical protein [Paenibacillus koleovorans]
MIIKTWPIENDALEVSVDEVRIGPEKQSGLYLIGLAPRSKGAGRGLYADPISGDVYDGDATTKLYNLYDQVTYTTNTEIKPDSWDQAGIRWEDINPLFGQSLTPFPVLQQDTIDKFDQEALFKWVMDVEHMYISAMMNEGLAVLEQHRKEIADWLGRVYTPDFVQKRFQQAYTAVQGGYRIDHPGRVYYFLPQHVQKINELKMARNGDRLTLKANLVIVRDYPVDVEFQFVRANNQWYVADYLYAPAGHIADVRKAEIIKSTAIYRTEKPLNSNSSQEEDRRVEGAFTNARELLIRYLDESDESWQDDLKWSGMALEIVAAGKDSRFIKLFSEPILGKTGHSMIIQYVKDGKVQADALWEEQPLVYSEHLFAEDKLLISGRRTSFANAIFIGQWSYHTGRWVPESLKAIPDTKGLLTVSEMDQEKHIILDNSRTPLQIVIKGTDLEIVSESDVTNPFFRWKYRPELSGFESRT